MTVRRVCPYPDCDWYHDEIDTVLIGRAQPTDAEAILRLQAQVVETVIRSHLDTEHPGWTMEQLRQLTGRQT